jgi:iron complex outermembrane receptor protein
MLIYGGYRRGYKRGGFNITFPNPEESLFKPETVDNYFAGVKTDFMIARIQGRFNVEAFYDKYHDAQRSYLSYVPDFGLTAPIQNVRGLTNLLNKVYILGATQTLLFGAQSDTYGPPRMFTAEASVRF